MLHLLCSNMVIYTMNVTWWYSLRQAEWTTGKCTSNAPINSTLWYLFFPHRFPELTYPVMSLSVISLLWQELGVFVCPQWVVPQAFLLSAVAWHAREAGGSGAWRYLDIHDSATSGRNAFACDRGRAFLKGSLRFPSPVDGGVSQSRLQRDHRLCWISVPRTAPEGSQWFNSDVHRKHRTVTANSSHVNTPNFSLSSTFLVW